MIPTISMVSSIPGWPGPIGSVIEPSISVRLSFWFSICGGLSVSTSLAEVMSVISMVSSIPCWVVPISSVIQPSISIRLSFWFRVCYGSSISTSFAEVMISSIPCWVVSIGSVIEPGIGIRFSFWLGKGASQQNYCQQEEFHFDEMSYSLHLTH